MKGHFVEPQEIAPQHYNGVDYSAKGIVLVRGPNTFLIWRKGGKCWAGIGFEPNYTEVHLHVVGNREAESYARIHEEEIFRGGRLAMYRIAADMKKIREKMGLPKLDVQHIHLKKTFVVDEL